jgi:hypothetical protein
MPARAARLRERENSSAEADNDNPTVYRSLVKATTASDANNSAALRQTIAVSFASARPSVGIFGSSRLTTVGLLPETIGSLGFMTANYSAIAIAGTERAGHRLLLKHPNELSP